jgi:dihydroxyacetone kinase phosphotransfer subunit
VTVALVLVSHVPEIAEGVRRLAAQMAPDVSIGVAGGDDDGGLGTSFDKVSAALEEARGSDGTAVLYDLGSAQLTAETAVEMLGDEQVRIVDAPLVEGALAAATAAQQGAGLAEVAGAAEQQYAAPFQLERSATAEPGSDWLTADVTLTNPLGLHARPAADLARRVGEVDAVLLLTGESREWVDARSVVAVIGLGLRGGDVVRLAAEGPQAAEALRTAVELVESGFGEVATGDGRTALAGVAAAPGTAVGPAVPVVARTLSDAPAGSVDAESQRLASAIDIADAQLAAVDEVFAPIAGAHRTLLTDPMLRGRASALVEQGSSAAQAWTTAVDEAYGVLSGVADAEMAARAADVLDVGARVTAALEGREFDAGLPGADELAGAVLVAEELLPSQVVQAHAAGVVAFVAGRGSEGAHAGQLARSLGLPAVLGVGDTVRAVRTGQRLRVDGVRGQVEVG